MAIKITKIQDIVVRRLIEDIGKKQVTYNYYRTQHTLSAAVKYRIVSASLYRNCRTLVRNSYRIS
jgi:hypothetical protein